MSWVWSGGKNFTTKRRMVFLGPERERQTVIKGGERESQRKIERDRER